MAFNTRSTLKYMLLPEVLPRIRDFTTSGFYYVSLCIALAFARCGLLPTNHPYLNPTNAGRFTLRQVLAEGRRHLVFRRENADQVIIYYAVTGGLFLLFMQALFLLLTLMVHHAHAGAVSEWYAKFFITPNPANDIAFRLLDYVFGYPGIYGSCVDPAIACPNLASGQPSPFTSATGNSWPSAYHSGLHTLFTFYNMGVALVGFVIFLYLVVNLVGQTAQTGKPFGKEFNYWAPVRLFIAVGLLMPFANGLDGAQLFTLYVAKWGSSLATNGWVVFNQSLTQGNTTLAGLPANLVFQPSQPNSYSMLDFMLVAKTCKYAESLLNNKTVKGYQVFTDTTTGTQTEWDLPATLTDALKNSQNHDVILRFGEYSPTLYPNERGNVSPLCGEMIITLQDLNSPGAMAVQNSYFTTLVGRWNNATANDQENDLLAHEIAMSTLPIYGHSPDTVDIDSVQIQDDKAWLDTQTAAAIKAGQQAEGIDPRWTQDVTTLGWGGASIWFNDIAALNGSFISSVGKVPVPSQYPLLMEQIAKQRQQHDKDTSGEDRYRPSLDDNTLLFFPEKGDINMSAALQAADLIWNSNIVSSRGAPIDDMLTGIFGFGGVFNLLGNSAIHPLAQLVGIGRSLVDNSISSLTVSAGVGLMGQLAKLIGHSTVGDIAAGAGGVIAKISMVCLVLGFFLFYGIPFIPFIYFFFAMGNWVKAIFEAMVGLPLWSISFVRTNSEGLMSEASLNGLYLILEIFLRPILIILGFIAAISVFSAQALVLSMLWQILLANVGGANAAAATAANGTLAYVRSVVDGFFYTIVYTIIMYILALSSFKLIDLFPKNILRWMGAHADPFHINDDSGAEFMQSINKVSDQVQSGFGAGITSVLYARNQ